MSAHRPSAPANPWRTLAAAVAAWRQRARQRAEFASLDDRTLRDLGLDRSEQSSILAESAGVTEATRRRVTARPPVARPAWNAR